MKQLAPILAVFILAGVASAQQPAPGNTAPPILQRPYEALRDFFNYYATAGFDYNSNGSYVLGGNGSGSAEGVNVGGGINGYHSWSTARLSLSYRGTYTDYSGPIGHADQQNLIANFQKQWKHWTLDVTESGGILFEQGAVYGTQGTNLLNPSTLVQANPYATQLRYEETQVAATYIQTYRLSYTFSSSYMIDRYNYAYAVGFSDLGGAGSVNYRLTRRTTLSGTYAHSLYTFQRHTGRNNVDSVYATLAHDFGDHVTVSLSAGGTRASGAGSIIYPIKLILPNGSTETVFAQIAYKSTNYLPYYGLTASKQFKNTTLYFTGSEAVTPGNGQYLTSRTLGVNAYISHQLRRSNLTVGTFYSHLSGIVTAAGIGASDIQGIDGSYSYNLMRHVGLNARYDFLRYGSFAGYGARPDNHLSIGLYFESKDVPLGLY